MSAQEESLREIALYLFSTEEEVRAELERKAKEKGITLEEITKIRLMMERVGSVG